MGFFISGMLRLIWGKDSSVWFSKLESVINSFFLPVSVAFMV